LPNHFYIAILYLNLEDKQKKICYNKDILIKTNIKETLDRGEYDMFAIIIGTHGKLAEEFLTAIDMIFGEVQNTATVTFLPGEGSADIAAKYQSALEKLDTSNGALFLIDIFGGTPYNAACRLVIKNEKYGIVTGISLPMIVEMANAQMIGGDTNIRALMEKALSVGQAGVRLFHTSMVNS